MRIKHYIKNLLIFFPLIFACKLTDSSMLLTSIIGFCIFCLLSSVIYIINDIFDREKDRKHPTKSSRPIASGAVSVQKAILLAGSLLFVIIASCLICRYKAAEWLILILYFMLNVLYSIWLKNIPIVDIAILASGFLFRVMFGAFITNIEISKWLYLTVVLMAFYLSLGKRRNELVKQKDSMSRPVLQFYTVDFLDKNMYMCLAIGIVFYSLWTFDTLTIVRIGSSALMWTIPVVILICFKYNLRVAGQSDGDPVEVLLHDRILFSLVLVFGLIVLGILYL